MMKEYTDELMFTKIFCICIRHGYTIEEVTQKIYNNNLAKNIVRVYQSIEIMMKHNIMIPKYQNNSLRFQVNPEILKGKEV